EKIMERDPSYTLLHRIRPGITSLGMIRYGYATTVDEMIARMRYDLFYLDKISLLTDMRIIVHTIYTVMSGKGI
ncbi:MAG: sugar transferase, partial [Paramuribaculum sp.]